VLVLNSIAILAFVTASLVERAALRAVPADSPA
jgi:hypothetical protein